MGCHRSARALRIVHAPARRPSLRFVIEDAGRTAHPPAPAPAIEVDFPDLTPYAFGNAGTPYVWTFGSNEPGPHVVIQALTHGNEVCGAIALDWILREKIKP